MIRAAFILAGVLVAGGGIVACGGDDSDESTSDASVELPAEVVEAYDNYTGALLAGDGEAMLEFVTDDFTWLSYGTNLMDAEYRADYVTRYYGNFEVDAIGEPTVVGGGDEYIFSTPERATTPAVADGISLVKMEKVDDTWLVSAHRFLGEGEGSG
jgi:hypothetical protein